MHFTKLSAALLGLAAFASAVPHQLEAGNVERRLTWTPRSLEQSNNADIEKRGGRGDDRGSDRGGDRGGDSISIVDTTIVQVSDDSRHSESDLVVLVQNNIQINQDKWDYRNNIRRNHYRNRNRNVNTVIIVITEIIDVRNVDRYNKRYMKRQVRADNNAREDVIVQITEVVAITIDGNDNRRFGGRGIKESRTVAAGEVEAGNILAPTAASEGFAAAIQTVEPNAPFAQNNQTVLLPSGAEAPTEAAVDFDPASILEENAEGLFVQKV